MRTTSPVILNNQPLIPAPYVSSDYEYVKSGQYVIGGILNIGLNGTIVGEDIVAQIQSINSLSANTNCITLIVGCEGTSDFIEGAGKITSVSVNVSDESPFTASYSINVALETVGGQPAVEADPEFLTKFGLNNAQYLKQFDEEIGVDGDATVVGYVDQALQISKSFIKASGRISIASSTTAICGNPSFNGMEQSINLLKQRFENLISFNFIEPNHPLSQYAGWNKWLDTKTINIDDSGTVSCSFEIYLNRGSCTPIAHIDVRTEDKLDHKNSNGIPNRSASGSIKGLSKATVSLLEHKTNANERLANAYQAYNTIVGRIVAGSWPGSVVQLSGQEGKCEEETCPETPPNLYYQRLSSNVSVSKVAGEITFSAEFGPTSSCATNNFQIESTVEEEFPVVRYKEFIVPNIPRSIIQYIGDTPARATVTVQGSLKNCDTTQKQNLIQCVKAQFNISAAPYLGWIKTEEQITDSKFSYKMTASFIRCDG